MNLEKLQHTISQLLYKDKGLLAMDESTETCNSRFQAVGVPQTEEMRRKYRELIVTTPALSKYISGAILFDETIRQRTDHGDMMIDVLKQNGIIPGIKVDEGTVELPGFHGHKVTKGLNGLTERLEEYLRMGAQFAKWRAVIQVEGNEPASCAIHANCLLLARYAVQCQEAGLVPIVEPEVLMTGNHNIYASERVTRKTLNILFEELYKNNVDLSAIILKPNMILPGLGSHGQSDLETIAELTILCLLETVPAAVPGIAFLSGGQTPELATTRLNSLHKLYDQSMPWKMTYSFSRALQQPALECWKGNDQQIMAAQRKLFNRASLNSSANRAVYNDDMEIE